MARRQSHADVKDGINDVIVKGRAGAVNPALVGTKAAAHYALTIAPQSSQTILLRLSNTRLPQPLADAAQVLALRHAEADAFYATRIARAVDWTAVNSMR